MGGSSPPENLVGVGPLFYLVRSVDTCAKAVRADLPKQGADELHFVASTTSEQWPRFSSH
jgi:hypothetical protein